jgi:hypothetical protein
VRNAFKLTLFDSVGNIACCWHQSLPDSALACSPRVPEGRILAARSMPPKKLGSSPRKYVKYYANLHSTIKQWLYHHCKILGLGIWVVKTYAYHHSTSAFFTQTRVRSNTAPLAMPFKSLRRKRLSFWEFLKGILQILFPPPDIKITPSPSVHRATHPVISDKHESKTRYKTTKPPYILSRDSGQRGCAGLFLPFLGTSPSLLRTLHQGQYDLHPKPLQSRLSDELLRTIQKD